MPKDLTVRVGPEALDTSQTPTLGQASAFGLRALNNLTIESVQFFDLDTNANAYNFPWKHLNVEPRRVCIIQNLGTNAFQFQQKNLNSNDYNAPGWSGTLFVSVPVNQQAVIAESLLTGFIRPATSGTAISGAIYKAVTNG